MVDSASKGMIEQIYHRVTDYAGDRLHEVKQLFQPEDADSSLPASVKDASASAASHYSEQSSSGLPEPASPGGGISFFSSGYVATARGGEQNAAALGHEDAASLIFKGAMDYAFGSSESSDEGVDWLFVGTMVVCTALVGVSAGSLISSAVQNSRNKKENAFTQEKIFDPLNTYSQALKNSDPQGAFSTGVNLREWLTEIYGEADLAYEALLMGDAEESREKRLAALKDYYEKNGIKISDYDLARVDRKINQALRQRRASLAIHPAAARAMLFGFEGDRVDNSARIRDVYQGVRAYYALETGNHPARLMGILDGNISEELPDGLAFLEGGINDTESGTASQRNEAIRLTLYAASSELRSKTILGVDGVIDSDASVFTDYAQRLGMEGGPQQLVRALLPDGPTADTLGLSGSDFDQLKGLAVSCQKKFTAILYPEVATGSRGRRIDIREFDRLFKYVGLERRYQDLFSGTVEVNEFIGQLKELGRLLKIETINLESRIATVVKPIAEQAAEVGNLSRDATKNPSIENFLKLYQACAVPGSGHPWMADLIAAFDEDKHINVIAHERMQPFSPVGDVSVSFYFNEANSGEKLQGALRAVAVYAKYTSLASLGSERNLQLELTVLCQELGIPAEIYHDVFSAGGEDGLQAEIKERIGEAFDALGQLDRASLKIIIEGAQGVYPEAYMTIPNLQNSGSRAQIRRAMLEYGQELPGGYRESILERLTDPSLPVQKKIGIVRGITGAPPQLSLMTMLAQSYEGFYNYINQLTGLDPSVKGEIVTALPDRGSLGASDFEDVARVELAERAFKTFSSNPNENNVTKLVDALTLMYAGVTEAESSEIFANARKEVLSGLQNAGSIELMGSRGEKTLASMRLTPEKTAALAGYAEAKLSEHGGTVAAVGRRPVGLPASSTAQRARTLQIGRGVLH